jgi:hypothetical protein
MTSPTHPNLNAKPLLTLQGLSVRPLLEHELPQFKALMTKHHYLKGGHSAGDTLRYVAELDGQWVALLTWGAAAYKLKHREHWIGWGSGLRKARLKLVAQNRRFCLLLKPGAVPNLASCVLGACLRRLRADWFEAFDYMPLVAETFVDPDYAQATCYKATNWQPLGVTAGSGRHARDFYQDHDKPKTLWCIELCKDARRLLADPAPLPEESRRGVLQDAVKSTEATFATCQSLMEVFALLRDPRARSGQRYPQKQLLAILALGMLCGCPDLLAIVHLGQSLSQMQLKALGGWQRKKTGLYEAPGYNAYYNLIGQMDVAAFDAALCAWLTRHEGTLPRDLAIDGKVLRGTKDEHGYRLALVALIENKTQRPVAQQAMQVISDKDQDKQEGELTAARRLLKEVPTLEGAIVTGDAMFTHADVMQSIVQEKGGDYLQAVKDNQPKLHEHVQKVFAANHPGAAKPHFFKTK